MNEQNQHVEEYKKHIWRSLGKNRQALDLALDKQKIFINARNMHRIITEMVGLNANIS